VIGHLLPEGLATVMSELDASSGTATTKSPPGTGSVTDARLLADLETIPGQPRYW
jgi:hypothetical protein